MPISIGSDPRWAPRVEDSEGTDHVICDVKRIVRVGRADDWHPEDRHQAIAYVLIEHAASGEDYLDHFGKNSLCIDTVLRGVIVSDTREKRRMSANNTVATKALPSRTSSPLASS